MATSGWDEPEAAGGAGDTFEEDEEADVGLVGGGSLAETMGDEGLDEADEHGDNLTRADEDAP